MTDELLDTTLTFLYAAFGLDDDADSSEPASAHRNMR
jgi:hypothetical protein